MPVTIKDVAAETGLAISTISKFMNGGNVRADNAVRIQEAVRRLGYFPDSIARGLRTARTYTIGLIVCYFSDAHVIAISQAIEETLQDNGYFTIICCHNDDYKRAEDAADFLIQKQVDGVILEGYATEDAVTGKFRDAGIPVVCLEALFGKNETDSVVIDGTWGTYRAVEDMIENGHTKIAIIAGTHGYYTAEERLRGFKRAMEDYELPLPEEYIIDSDYTCEGGERSLRKIWTLKNRPTAVFISNYSMCIGAVAAANRLKIRIPDDLTVTTYDDMELSKLVKPHLSAVRQSFSEMGKMAAQLLLRRINGDISDFPKRVRLKSKYIPRDSVGRLQKNNIGEWNE